MATTASSLSSSIMTNRPMSACVRCATRKVKCDRQRPCSACAKHNVECIFSTQPSTRRRHRRPKDHVLADRLKLYEELLQGQGIDPSKLPATPESLAEAASSPRLATSSKESSTQATFPIESESNQSINKTQLVHGHGRFKFVDNSLWTRVVEELHTPEEALEDSSNYGSELETSEDDLVYTLRNPRDSKSKCHHPPSETILQLWQIFVENIDPLTKIVHVPTLRTAVERAASNINTIPRNFETLMFAIYSTAVMSLKDDECRKRFSESRRTLLSKYITATKIALSRAKFMGTISLVVLQALIFHLLSVRDVEEPRVVWSLTGIAVRIAQSMGLERDGEGLGLTPFETEMRRRVWWLLKTHDFRTAELCGLSKFRDLDAGPASTKWPTNVNDNDLYPGMPSLPKASEPPMTDFMMLAFRYELTNFAAARISKFKKEGKSVNQFDLRTPSLSSDEQAEANDAAEGIEAMLEMKYLRYCDPSQPLHLMTMLMGRFAINTIRFLTCHPRKWASLEQTPMAERQRIWEVSVKLLEQHRMILTSPQLSKFAWHAPYFIQWHAFIHVLDTLRFNPLTIGAEKVWQAISDIYANTPNMIADTKKPIHIAVGNLCLKAYSEREVALQRNGATSLPRTPSFISQLCQQREIAKRKRESREAKDSHAKDTINVSNTVSAPSRSVNSSIHASAQALNLRSDLTPEPATFNYQTGHLTERDSFWALNGFDDGQFGSHNTQDEVMDMDLDIMLAQDFSTDGNIENAIQSITWEQWDAWLADSNLMPSQP